MGFGGTNGVLVDGEVAPDGLTSTFVRAMGSGSDNGARLEPERGCERGANMASLAGVS